MPPMAEKGGDKPTQYRVRDNSKQQNRKEKTMTKFERQLYRNYEEATMYTIYDAYKRPSQDKIDAYESCVRRCLAMHGGPWCIPSKNIQCFTFAFMYHKEDGTAWLHYETAQNTYDFKVV